MASNCSKFVEVDKLHFENNVRTPECEHIPAMVQSFMRHGFKANHPLVVSEKADGRLLVLNGNRRGKGLHCLRDTNPGEYARILPQGKVPAIVHKGLTSEEEVYLRIDHSSDEDRVPLDEWSTCLAIKQLVKVGMDTQGDIATKLGLFIARGKNVGQPNRSYVQPRVNLARLPQFVQDEFRKLCVEGTDATPVRWGGKETGVAALHKIFNREFADHPNGDGPMFQAAWKKAITPPAPKDPAASESQEASALTPAEAIKRAQAMSSQSLKQAFLAATQQGTHNLAEIDKEVCLGESAIRTLSEIRIYLGENDYQELLSNAKLRANEQRRAEESQEETDDSTGKPQEATA